MTYPQNDPYQQPYSAPPGQPYQQPYSAPPGQQYGPQSPYGSPYYDPQPQYVQPMSVQPMSVQPMMMVPSYQVAYITPQVGPYAIVAPTSGAATASLVLGIIGFAFGWCLLGIPSLLAVIFGHIALVQTRNDRLSGRGMAIAGLVLGYLLVVPTLLLTFAIFGSVLAGSASGT